MGSTDANKPLKIIGGADDFGCALKDSLMEHLRSKGIELQDLGTDKYYNEVVGHSQLWRSLKESTSDLISLSEQELVDSDTSYNQRSKIPLSNTSDQRVSRSRISTPIRSCWAFSTVAVVEGINQIMTDDLISLSEQELVDYDTSYNQGCNGGLMDYAFEFIINNGGLDSEEDYHYTAYDGSCDAYRKNAHVVTIDDYEDVPENDEKSLKKAAANQPISVAIKASGREFHFYESGVFTSACRTHLDHAVILVGYGSELGTDYWIIKNSWGKSWGEEGFIRLLRNLEEASTGICGIAMEASYLVKEGANPPNPGHSPASPIKPPTVCDSYYSYPQSNTCCCMYDFGGYCYAWGYCPLDSATCCDDHYNRCPSEYPVCDLDGGTCLKSSKDPFGVKMLKHTLAKPYWAATAAVA